MIKTNSTAKRSKRWAHLFFVLYIALLLIPGAGIFWLQWPNLSSISGLGLPFSLLLLAFWFAIFGRVLWLGSLLLAPFALLVVPYVYYLTRYHAMPKVGALGTLFETSQSEALDFLDKDLPLLFVCMIVSVILTIVAITMVWRAHLRWRGKGRRRVVYLFLLVMIVPPVLSVARKPVRAPKYPTVGATIQHETNHLLEKVARTYPFGAVFPLVEYAHFKADMRQNLQVLSDYRFNASLARTTDKRQVYVLVIGESSRRDHWQLFGYERATNPQLMQQSNLVLISDMVSAYPQTRRALPVMLTRKTALDEADKPWPEASIVRAMSEAGFETWWVSNQHAIGLNDSAVAIHSHEAEHVIWLDRLGKGKDEELVTSLQEALQTSDKNLFVVLHMMGSHEAYEKNYPNRFTTFTPTMRDTENNAPKWQKAENSYDNTIVYSDDVLSKIIGQLEKIHAVSALWYASDHGEALRSKTCHKHGHGYQTYHEFTIPAFMWYSDAYQQQFPRRIDTIKSHADQKTMSQNAFPTLVDMFNITIPDYADKDEWSLMSQDWQAHTRWVSQFDTLDFDNVKITGACKDLQQGEY